MPNSSAESAPGSNAARAQPDWPPAVIAGAWQTGVLAQRCLVRRGVQAVCIDSNHSQPGFRSAYGRALLCPDPDTQDASWHAFMLELARKFERRPVLIASSDKFVSAMARNESSLRDRYILSPGLALQGLLADKPTQYRLAARHGLPMPETRFVDSADGIRQLAGTITYPCLVKPGHFREWQKFARGHPLRDSKIAIAGSADALLDTYRLVRDVTPDVIVQEIIQGGDTAKRVYLSCRDAQGRRIASAMFRELRCDPLGFGPASVSEPVVDAEVEALCDRFLESIRYAGICEFEMKRDSRDGRVKLIEANPRLSGGGDAAPYAGVDLCWLHYLDLTGQEVVPVVPNGRDFRHIVLRSDARAVPAYRRAGLINWKDVLHSYRRPVAFFDLDWHDWRYSLETLVIAACLFVAATLRGLFSRKGAA